MNLLYELTKNDVDMLDELVGRRGKLQKRAHISMNHFEGRACDEDAQRYSYQIAEDIGEAACICKDFWDAVCEMCECAGVDREEAK